MAGDGVGGEGGGVEGGGVEGGAAVGAVGAQQGGGDGQLERAGGVVGEDGSGGGGERVVGVGRGPDVDLDAAAEPVDVGAQHPVVGELACRRGQRARRGGLAGGPGGAGGRVQERRAVLLVGGELGGALVGGGGGGVPAASFGSLGGGGQAGDDVRVGAVDGCGAVPRVPVRVCLGAEGVGERAVRFVAFPAGGGLVHRGADQRVPYPHDVAVDDEQPGAFRRVQAVGAGAELRGGGADGGDVPGVVGGGDQQQGLHVGRQPAAPVEEDPLDAGGQVQLGGQRFGAGELLRGQGAGKLDEGERVPGGLGHQPVRDVVGHRAAGCLGEQRPGRAAGQRREGDRGDAVGCERVALAVAGGEHDRDPVRAQAPGGDQHRVGGGLVEPLRVVEDAQHGRVLGGLGQHRQGREGRQERFDRDVVRLAERRPKRSGLRRRDPVEDAEDGTQQPVQRRERQRRLGLHALGAQHPHVAAGGRDEVLEQRGLPHARLTVQQQRAGAPAAGVVQERGEASPLVAPPVQHVADATRPACGRAAS